MGNKILAIIAIVFVGIAFGLVAVVVFLTRGRSDFWVDKKLRTGGLLLTLSSIIGGASGCGVFQPTCYDTARPPEQGEPEVMCYDMPVENYRFALTKFSNKERLVVEGTKNGPDGRFIYKLIHDKDTLSSGNLDIDSTDHFKIDLGKKGPLGKYYLAIDEAQGFATSFTFEIQDDTK